MPRAPDPGAKTNLRGVAAHAARWGGTGRAPSNPPALGLGFDAWGHSRETRELAGAVGEGATPCTDGRPSENTPPWTGLHQSSLPNAAEGYPTSRPRDKAVKRFTSLWSLKAGQRWTARSSAERWPQVGMGCSGLGCKEVLLAALGVATVLWGLLALVYSLVLAWAGWVWTQDTNIANLTAPGVIASIAMIIAGLMSAGPGWGRQRWGAAPHHARCSGPSWWASG